MLKVFIISVGIAFSIEIVHSILTKGVKFTLEFFGGGFLFGFAREFIYFSFIHTYEFPDMPFKMLNVPIFIPIGWVFTFYLAYEFVNKLVEPKTIKDYKNFITFAAFFSTFICIPIETAAMNMNWWVLYSSANGNIAPFYLMGGWFVTSVLFFYIYLIMKGKLPPKYLWFVIFIIIFNLAGEFHLLDYVSVVLASEFHLLEYLDVVFWGLQIIAWAGIIIFGLKYNKEVTFILLIYWVICFICIIVFPGANGMLVSVLFTSIFVHILVKLRLRDEKHQLSIKE